MRLDETKTAIITGASSGIGESFANQLAAKGYQLLLVARRQDRLHKLAKELDQKYGAQVEALAADLSDDAGISLVEERIQGMESVDILVNNAGFGMSGYFTKLDLERNLEMIELHVIAAVRLTYSALTGMISRESGSIINVSSVAAFLPWGNVTYNATKAYLVAFSEALNAESRSKNIRVQALCPGFTVTEFHDSPDLLRIRRSRLPKIFWLSTDFVVAESLKALAQGKVICIPGAHYRLVVALGRSPITSPLLRAIVLRIRQKRTA